MSEKCPLFFLLIFTSRARRIVVQIQEAEDFCQCFALNLVELRFVRISLGTDLSGVTFIDPLFECDIHRDGRRPAELEYWKRLIHESESDNDCSRNKPPAR